MYIHELTLYTPNLAKQVKFYTNVLGLTCTQTSTKEAVIQMGSSHLRFIERATNLPYHFAINIPSNQEEEALQWLKNRVEILKEGDTELHDFDFWNAKAIYFYDADGNILEFIARKNLNITSEQAFGADSLLHISEMGVPTSKNISALYDFLHSTLGVSLFSGNLEGFAAIGEETALFICIPASRTWFPKSDPSPPADFSIVLQAGKNRHELEYDSETCQFILRRD